MGSLWSFLAKPKNQKTLSWLGGGGVVAAGGIWVVVTYLWPHDRPSPATSVVQHTEGAGAPIQTGDGNTVLFNAPAKR
jgi:hypothetical protein